MRSHIHHTISSMRSVEVIEVSKELELVSVLMYVNEERILSHMLPECSMVSFYLSIMLWSIGRILLMFYSEFHKKLGESLSKLLTTVSTNHLNSCSIVWWCMKQVPDKLHTGSDTMLRMYTGDNKPTTIIKSIILNLWSCFSKWKADIELYFLSWYFQRVSLQTLSSHIFSISRIAYLVSLKDSIYSRLINPFSCNALYSP